jgi:hypothetical protein
MLALAWSLLSSPVALVPWAGASLSLDAKRRREEAWLSEEHPEYEADRREVRRTFMPFVWQAGGGQARRNVNPAPNVFTGCLSGEAHKVHRWRGRRDHPSAYGASDLPRRERRRPEVRT